MVPQHTQMKDTFRFWARLVSCLAVVFALSSCGGGDDSDEPDVPGGTPVENPTKPVADPDDTVLVNLLNNGDQYIAMGAAELGMNSSNNLVARRGEIISVGEVAGLGNIQAYPTSGFSSQAACLPGNGYVIRHCNYDQVTWHHIYVTGFMESMAGGIMGCTLKYVSMPDNPIVPDTHLVNISENSYGEIRLQYPTSFAIDYAKSNLDYIEIWCGQTTSWGLDFQSIRYSVRGGYEENGEDRKLVLKNSVSEVEIIFRSEPEENQ